MKHLRYLLIAVCLLGLVACGRKESEPAAPTPGTQAATKDVDLGAVKDSVYENKYFGFRMTFPTEWAVQERAVQQRLAETGTKVLAGDDRGLKSAMEASQVKTLNLFAVFKHPLGAPVPFNPNINCVAENVTDFPGIKTGKDYLYHAKKLLGGSQLKIEFSDDLTSVHLGGAEFYSMTGSVTLGTMTIRQIYYTTIRKGFALNIILSDSNAEEAAVLKKIVESISFQ